MKWLGYALGLFFLYVNSITVAADKEKIHFISSSSQYDERSIPHIIKTFQEKDFDVDTTYLHQEVSDLGYVNTDKKRAENLIEALKDPQVKYLWFIRGGGGAFNLLPDLYQAKSEIEASPPKTIIGFSDVTAIHYFLNKYLHWPSVHGIVAAYNKDTLKDIKGDKLNMNNTIEEIFHAIKEGVSYHGLLPLNQPAEKGATGTLHGGNLTLVNSFFSTSYEINSPNEILILEDVGTSYRQLDRSLHQLLYKKNYHPEAIIFGQFYSISANDEERLIFKTVIENFAKSYPAPVFYYPYFGHGTTNYPFLLSTPATITCEPSKETCSLQQTYITKK